MADDPIDTDVAIIGGGPAGLAAAIHLARAGIPTILFEKSRYPVDKACGEGLMPPGVAHLHALDVRPAGGFPFAGIRYHAGPALTAATPFAEGPGLGLRRTALSAALHRRAARLPTLALYPETAARPVARQGDRILVEAAGRHYATRLLVGADGLNSGVRRWAGLDGPPPRWQRWGARRHFGVRPWSRYVDVHWSERGLEAYVTPTGPDEVGVAFLWHRDRYRAVRGGDQLFPSLLAAFPRLQARLDGATPLDDVAAIGPLHRPVAGVSAPGLLLAGDAAGYLDAITGEGISLALAQAAALAETVLPLLARQAPLTAAALHPYRRRHQAISRAYLRFTRLALFLGDHPALVPPLLHLFRRLPVLFRLALSAGMGTLRKR